MPGTPEPLAASPRGKKRSASTFSNSEDRKKARGRPRVEPKDQTAADRRRTQIRLAQRSYRERKEGTITELQSKVSQLESLLFEMNDSFQDISQNAQTSNLDTANFQLSRQINQAADRFRELSQAIKHHKSNGANGSSDESSSDPPEHPNSPSSLKPTGGSPLITSKKGPPTGSTKNPPPTIVSTKERGVPSVWGYETLYDASSDGSDGIAVGADATVQAFSQPPAQPQFSAQIPEPVWQAIGPLTPYDHTFFNFSFGPGSEMPSPRTYAALEETFERRLHRGILEAGVRLLSLRTPPRARMQAVFGTIMKYYSQLELRDFFIECLNRGSNEPLESRAVYPYAGPYTQQLWYIEPHDVKAREELLRADDNVGDGAWFVPRDVQHWLAMKSIEIPRGAQFVEWQYETVVPAPPQQQQQYPPWPSPTASVNGETAGDPGDSSFDSVQPTSTTFVEFDPTPPHSISSMMGNDTQTQWSSDSDQQQQQQPPVSMNGDVFPASLAATDPWLQKSRPHPPMQRISQKFSFDVEQFLADMLFATVCLGKCPGFRRRDVEKAFNNSLIPVTV